MARVIRTLVEAAHDTNSAVRLLAGSVEDALIAASFETRPDPTAQDWTIDETMVARLLQARLPGLTPPQQALIASALMQELRGCLTGGAAVHVDGAWIVASQGVWRVCLALQPVASELVA